MADHMRVTVGLGYSMVLFGTTQAQNTAGIRVISMAMAAPNVCEQHCSHSNNELRVGGTTTFSHFGIVCFTAE